ncbi:MAG: hypothetical protein JSV94_04630 [Methanobacteriota archaeon]|nr:MAG: hypothetical protein JSV94_04630 [Euryarchaeota archaeon]
MPEGDAVAAERGGRIDGPWTQKDQGHASVLLQISIDTVNSEVLQTLNDAVLGYPGTKNSVISRTDDYTGYA